MSFSTPVALPRRGRYPISRRVRRFTAVGGAALVAPFLGASPVGTSLLDWVWSAGIAAIAAYLGTTAKRGPLMMAAAVVVISARTGPATAFAFVSIVAAGASTWNLRRRAVFSRGVAAGAAALSLMASDGRVSPLHFAAATVAVGSLLVGSGLANARSPIRRRIAWIGGGFLVVAVIATAVALLGVADSSRQLRVGANELRLGLSAARQGDVAAATDHLDSAEVNVERARRKLRSYGSGARLFPVTAQQINAVVDVLDGVGDSAAEARRVTGALADDDLQITAGTVDLDALRGLQTPLARLENALDDVVTQARRHAADPLLPPLRDRIGELEREAVRAQDDAAKARLAAEVLPDALGGSGLKRYLVVFTSPAEARGRLGFPGSFAEVTFDNGRYGLGEHGSTSQLLENTVRFEQPPFDRGDPQLRPYLDYGVTRSVLASTIPPDFPTVAKVIAEMWKQTGRPAVDGVLRLDPAALSRLLTFTGPVQVSGRAEPVGAENVEQFLLIDQYLEFTSAQSPRREALEEVAEVTFERLETADLPAPRRLVSTFGPLASGGNFHVALFGAEPSRLPRSVGLAGAWTAPKSDGLAVTTVNGLGNKIDSFLRQSIRYRGHVTRGRVESTVDITLTNTAPSTGLPDYVIGSFASPAPPRGTNRTTVFVYSAVPAAGITVGGQPVPTDSTVTAGWHLYVLVVELPPGGVTTISLDLDGELPAGPYHLRLEPGGSTVPAHADVALTVNGRDVRYSGALTGPQTVR